MYLKMASYSRSTGVCLYQPVRNVFIPIDKEEQRLKGYLNMSPRLTDWNIALATGLAFTAGIISLVSGLPQEWFIFALHGIAGFWLLLLLWGKLRRVWPRLIHPRRWDRRTVFGLLALLLVTLALGSGIWWVTGGDWYFAGLHLLNWHIALS